MFGSSFDVIMTVLLPALLGTALVVVGAAAGWAVGRRNTASPVRLVAWWVRHVAVPLLTSRSWVRRFGTIFINNTSVLATLVCLGAWRITALAGVAGLGLCLGIGMRILAAETQAWGGLDPAQDRRLLQRIRVGVALNLLEPPAIVLTCGLCLGRPMLGSAQEAWETFALWVVPATALAAGGEAIWLGACCEAGRAKAGGGSPVDVDDPGTGSSSRRD